MNRQKTRVRWSVVFEFKQAAYRLRIIITNRPGRLALTMPSSAKIPIHEGVEPDLRNLANSTGVIFMPFC
jgi:hypothetical protein